MQAPKREGESNTMFFLRNAFIASFSACVAESVTLPMDTVKVRL